MHFNSINRTSQLNYSKTVNTHFVSLNKIYLGEIAIFIYLYLLHQQKDTESCIKKVM